VQRLLRLMLCPFNGPLFEHMLNINKQTVGRPTKRLRATDDKMRLICPNCGAQYEVPDEVIPETGRDVQCSECSTTWFQHHRNHLPDTDAEPISEPSQYDAQGAPLQDDDYGVDPIEDHGADALLETEVTPSASQGDIGLQRRALDPSITDVLREEAARETKARKNEQRGGIETQEELGLQDADDTTRRRSEEARARMARLRGVQDAESEQSEDTVAPSRRNLLPDIEDINASLTPDTKQDHIAPPPTDPSATVAPKDGFRSGFRLALILATLGAILYVFAPQIAEAVPAIAGPLESFADAVNAWRTALNEFVQTVAASLTGDDNNGR